MMTNCPWCKAPAEVDEKKAGVSVRYFECGTSAEKIEGQRERYRKRCK